MGKRIWRDLFMLIAVFAVVWSVFTYLPIFPKSSLLNVSIDTEQEIGDNLVENYLNSYNGIDTIDNYDVNSFIDSVFTFLSVKMETVKFNYTFIVVNNDQINAFAMPGGYIIIYSGLIEFCDSPEEFSSVIAHEIGHIENRHLISRLIKKLGIAILLSNEVAVLGEVSQTAIETAFDRKQEREADSYAFSLLDKSGISPRIIATFFRKLETKGLTYNKNFELLMTHPHHDERIKAALRYNLSENFEEKQLDFDLKKVQNIISNLN